MSELEKAARQALDTLEQAEPVVEPVAWVGLTDKDRLDIYGQASTDEVDFYARAIEAALKEKNTKQAEPVQAEPVVKPVVSEALRLAEYLDLPHIGQHKSANELRRLHAEIIRLEARERGRQIARSLNVQEPPDAKPKQAEPVAWLSIDCIGERYLCFSKPLDNDPVQPLYTHPPQQAEPVADADSNASY
jgi:hypothetical protein